MNDNRGIHRRSNCGSDIAKADTYSKHTQASLSLISTDWLRLRVALGPRFRDLAIFVVTTDRQTDYFTPAHARGVINLCVSRINAMQGLASLCEPAFTLLYTFYHSTFNFYFETLEKIGRAALNIHGLVL